MKALIKTISHNPIKSILTLGGLFLMYHGKEGTVPFVTIALFIMWENF